MKVPTVHANLSPTVYIRSVTLHSISSIVIGCLIIFCNHVAVI